MSERPCTIDPSVSVSEHSFLADSALSFYAMAILDDLNAFLEEHRRCGELRNGTSAARPDVVWIDCSCGGYIAEPVASTQDDPEEKGGLS